MFKPFETAPFAMHGDAVAGVKAEARATQVLDQLDELKARTTDDIWSMTDLWEEAHDNNYHNVRGFNDFDDYINQSNFEYGAREVRYRIKVNKNSRKVGISRDKFKTIAFSKIKEIFTLNPETDKDHIVRLVEAAKDMSLETVKAEVRAVKGLSTDQELTWRNFQLLRIDAETQVDVAIERIKREYGDTIDVETGEPKDISDGKALVMLCADKNSEPDYMQHEIEQALEREGSDGSIEA